MIKVRNLHREGNQWFWRLEAAEGGPVFAYDKGVYFTNKQGDGIFFQDDKTAAVRQIVGTCQFSACATASGMRRKLTRDYNL